MNFRKLVVAAFGLAVLSGCGTAQGSPATSSSPTPSPSPSSSQQAAALPAQLRFTKIGDLGAGSASNMGGPAAFASSGLWIASEQGNQLIQFTAFGGASPVALPPQPTGNFPQGIAAGSDGSIWISESDSVLRIGSDQKVTTFAVDGQPTGRIAQGPDTSIWVTELGKDRVARIMNGQVREFPLPPAPLEVQCGGRCPYGITEGPDGNVWITESQLANGDLVGRMTPQGDYKDWPVPEPGAALNDITAGPDQALWFGESRARRLGRITSGGAVTERAVDLPAHATGTELVSAGGGLIWYAASLAPGYREGPIGIGAALPSGTSRFYQIAGTQGQVAAVVPVPAPQGEGVVDVITSSGQIWQGSTS